MAKRIVGLSTFIADPVGNRTLYVNQDSVATMNQGARRVTRTKTLDGNAVAYDAGFSPSDLTFTISVPATDVTITAFFAMLVKTYNLIRLTTSDGVYSAVPSQYREEDGVATLEALVMEQLA